MNYLNGKDFPNKESYKLQASADGSSWYALCNVGGTDNPIVKGAESEAVKKKLAGRAKSVGLLADRYNSSITDKKPFDGTGDKNKKDTVYMLVQ